MVMRIALISTPFLAVPPRLYGGTELIVHELAEGLVKRGHYVELFATGDSTTTAQLRFLYPDAQWPPLMLPDVNHATWAMRQVIERGPFDLIHAHSAAALACSRFIPNVPMVYTIHHARDEQLSAFYAFYHDAHYIAISEDQCSREVPLPHVDVIYHGLDPANYQCTTNATGEYVCFIGRFSRVKGPQAAIDAAQCAGVPIRLAGEVHPPDESWVNAELRPRLRQQNVTCVGPVGGSAKTTLLCRARALLAPLAWNEPFGLVLIEAMLSGCPVVAYSRGSVPELVEDGVTGFIATSFEHMVELIRPGGAIESIDRARCRQRAMERFNADRMVAEHVTLYERIRNPAASLRRSADSRVA
jgi:glycosyltransferase involved in cell wall biosynthesis